MDEAQNLQQKVTLRHPINFEGRRITEINLDFDRLTGRALRNAERAYTATGGIPMPMKAATSIDYCAYCAAAVSDVPMEALEELRGDDYIEVTTLVQSFLLGADLTPEIVATEQSESNA